ncbi:MAG: hypothetical protein Q7T68_13915 [Sphingopyxis sp.]|nr:hypothetical protein [Sphingopyxis sp.]
MTTQLQQWLGGAENLREFDRWFETIMRRGDFDELDAFLTEELLAHPHKICSLCLSRPLSTVRVTGWDDLAADFARDEAKYPGIGPITAIGADLSDHVEPDDDSWGLEVNFYDDDPFPFSKGDIGAINAEAASTSTEWQGNFRDIVNSLSVVGLGRIYRAIAANDPGRADPGEPAPVSLVADRLGRYFVTLRFHQALVRDAAHYGLPRAMVLMGGAHDVAPWYEAAYWCDTVREDAGEVTSILAARDAANKARFNAETEQTIADWRDRRNAIVRRQLRADKHQTFADYSASRDAVFYSMTGLGDGRPSHELSEHEYEMLLHAWRCQRAEKIGDDPDAIPVPEKPRGSLFGLFRRAS